MKMLVRCCLNLALWLLSYVVPKKKGLLLFGAANGCSFKGNPQALYLHLLKKFPAGEMARVVWTSQNRKVVDALRQRKMPVVAKWSPAGFWAVLRSDWLVIEQSALDVSFLGVLLGRFNIAQLWHGTGFKEIGLRQEQHASLPRRCFNAGLRREYRSYRFIAASCSLDRQRKIASFGNPNVVITGYPRNDLFFEPESTIVQIKRRLGVDCFARVIVYAPTFRDDQLSKPFSEGFWKRLDAIFADRNDILLVKRHPFDHALTVPSGLDRIRDVTADCPDIQELLAVADLLISDYSGVVTDYSLTRRPMIFYIYDYAKYVGSCRQFYYDFKKTLPGPFVDNEDELIARLTNLGWFEEKAYQMRYAEFVATFHAFLDGGSCQRVLAQIEGWS